MLSRGNPEIGLRINGVGGTLLPMRFDRIDWTPNIPAHQRQDFPMQRFLKYLATAALAAASFAAPAFADALDDIKKRGTIEIGLEGTYPPFNYVDEKGVLVGFEVEIANAVAERLGVKPNFQPGKWDGLLAALDVKRIDAVINQVTITPEREQKYAFSEPYTISGIQILTRSDTTGISKPADLAGKRVGVGLGTAYEKWLRANAPGADIRTYDDDASRNQDLLVGRIDAALNDRLVVSALLKQYAGKLVAAGEPFATQKQAVAMRKDSGALPKAVNDAFTALRADGTLKKISEKWFGADVTQ
jgi:cystine transport system substrate-binding protein